MVFADKQAGEKSEVSEDVHQPQEVVADSKPRKKRRTVIDLYDNIGYDVSYHRRSLRNLDKHSRSRSKSHRRHFQTFGSSIIRRSDRQPKKVFETFNESEIQRSIERKHQEMLEMEQASMYDSIKRRRGDLSETQDDEDDTEEESEGETDEEGEGEGEEGCGYSLRKTKPRTNMYQAPPLRSGHKRQSEIYSIRSPIHKSTRSQRIPQHASPHHRNYKRRRRASSTSSDDEVAFERRKAKSMGQGRLRCLPMNFKPDEIVDALKGRERARDMMGSSLADVDPMTIDTKISFSDVGGLDHHIRSLKEMVVFPLLYPEVFEKFSIAPPRGVLFYGPPGTGKTLVARALANECGCEGKKVAFFMRKGADCLSKWVGESERQLRLLFDQAYSMRPSIIFFDEIDGIAPVRSTRQDQIHSSIVSTLLALMDGLDARGEIVVIGATNRLDAIDPALRRPGRFDREFLFNLPNKKARQKILNIHTSAWHPKLSSDFLADLAEKCVGYCGADLKSLCTEVALFALRRRYPQIYESDKKLVLDMNEIKVSLVDFRNAMKAIIPASHRSATSPGRSLTDHLKPLLQKYLNRGLLLLNEIFPPGKSVSDEVLNLVQDFDEEENANIFEKRSKQRTSTSPEKFCHFSRKKVFQSLTYRPRLLIYGESGNGQTTSIAPAFLFSMEHLTTHVLDLPALFGTSSRAPEEAVAQTFREVKRTSPSILYLPHIEVWWTSVHETTRATFMTLLDDLPSSLPVLFLATADVEWAHLPESIQDLFSSTNKELLKISCPTLSDRYEYFKNVILDDALTEPPKEKRRGRSSGRAEVLPVASPPKPRELSAEERNKLVEYEESVLRELRLHLRQVTWKLLADRKFKEFSKPVDLEEVDDYKEVIKQPMDLSTVMTRINSHRYHSCALYLEDIDLITNNCLEYNPEKDQYDKLLRNRACELRDVAYALVHNDLDPDFDKTCIEILESRKSRGYVEKNAPSFLKVAPKSKPTDSESLAVNDEKSATKPVPNLPDPTGVRFSRRVRGISESMEYDEVASVRRVTKKTKTDGNTIRLDTSQGHSDCLNDSLLDGDDIEETSHLNGDCLKDSTDVPIITCSADMMQVDEDSNSQEVNGSVNKVVENVKRNLDFPELHDGEGPSLVEFAETLLSKLVKKTDNYNVQSLERIFANLSRIIVSHKKQEDRMIVLQDVQSAIDAAS